MANDQWITITGTRQLDQMVNWLKGLDDIVRIPKVMVPLVHSFGRFTFAHFEMEVTPLGRRWQGLSEMTNEKREERGYPTVRPILEQSGQLKDAAATAFRNWPDNGKNVKRSYVSPYGNFEALSMNASISDGRFSAKISGSRVEHQYGKKMSYGKESKHGKQTRKSVLPSRPFWGITQEMISQGLPISMMVLMTEWRDSARGFHAR
jgi:hypothetical protein